MARLKLNNHTLNKITTIWGVGLAVFMAILIFSMETEGLLSKLVFLTYVVGHVIFGLFVVVALHGSNCKTSRYPLIDHVTLVIVPWFGPLYFYQKWGKCK